MSTIKTKPFDLAAALAGEPVVTREGKEAKILHVFKELEFPILGLIVEEDSTSNFSLTGSFLGYQESSYDLFMRVKPQRVPFDLEKAKAGAELITRCRQKAKFLVVGRGLESPVICLVDSNGIESIEYYSLEGKNSLSSRPNPFDLFILE